MLCWKSRGCRLCWSKRTIKSGPRHAESDAVDVESRPEVGFFFAMPRVLLLSSIWLKKKKQLVGAELEQLLE